jgi:hypothetical protein
MLLLCFSTTVSLSCSTFHTTQESINNPIDPEVLSSPDSQHQASLKQVQAELNISFQESWQATLDTLKRSGYPIFEAIQEEGRIRTLDRQFEGPKYPWRESYSIQMAAARDNHTLIRVRRTVKVFRRLFHVGPTIWMIRPSNGQREKMLIEQIEQRLGAGAMKNEKPN